MSTLSERLRTGVDDPGIFDEAADELDRLTARVAEWQRLYRRALNEANGLTNYAEDRPELYSAEKRLARIDHFAREAFEKFASGVECELTNYRWFEAGWDARGDTVAAAPLPSAPMNRRLPADPFTDPEFVAYHAAAQGPASAGVQSPGAPSDPVAAAPNVSAQRVEVESVSSFNDHAIPSAAEAPDTVRVPQHLARNDRNRPQGVEHD